ncbi:MaoC family dehydratase [Aquibium sp. LZ166]|uniref:MaoC family dehydratase n=1 Tax=Aquibium pacificus TaxID=3153579 RepID=A0ABV3SD68_9HYPH
MRTFESPYEIRDVIGERLGSSDWLTVTQSMIDDFANATGDRQWIHVDVERARRESPEGTTIAHGYLVMSLIGVLQPTLYTVKAQRTINYGINKLRFLKAVPAGARIRSSETIRAVEEGSGGLRVSSELTIELDGADKPALVAEIVFVYFP